MSDTKNTELPLTPEKLKQWQLFYESKDRDIKIDESADVLALFFSWSDKFQGRAKYLNAIYTKINNLIISTQGSNSFPRALIKEAIAEAIRELVSEPNIEGTKDFVVSLSEVIEPSINVDEHKDKRNAVHASIESLIYFIADVVINSILKDQETKIPKEQLENDRKAREEIQRKKQEEIERQENERQEKAKKNQEDITRLIGERWKSYQPSSIPVKEKKLTIVSKFWLLIIFYIIVGTIYFISKSSYDTWKEYKRERERQEIENAKKEKEELQRIEDAKATEGIRKEHEQRWSELEIKIKNMKPEEQSKERVMESEKQQDELKLAVILAREEKFIKNRYVITEDLVEDKETGLIWMRCSIGQSWENSTCQGEALSYQWHDAHQQFDGHGFFKYANFDDWRLPTLDELNTLKHSCQKECNNTSTIAQSVFKNTKAADYLSSDEGSIIRFDSLKSGKYRRSAYGSYEYYRGISSGYVRLVRDVKLQ